MGRFRLAIQATGKTCSQQALLRPFVAPSFLFDSLISLSDGTREKVLQNIYYVPSLKP